MSTTYNANGTIPAVTQPLTWAIDSSTATTPIVVSVGAAIHGFATGDTVEITAHDQANANGLWVITVTGVSTFSLDGSTSSGVGTATGIVQDYSVNPLITIPADGDAASASSVNPAFEGIFNAVPFLYQRAGAWRVYAEDFVAVAGLPWPATLAWSITPTLSSGNWITLASTASILTGYCRNGDVIDVSAIIGSDTTGGASIADRQPLAVQITIGAAVSQGTAALVNANNAYVETSNPSGRFLVLGAPAGGSAFSISLAAYDIYIGQINLFDQYSVKYTQYRSNA
jgi:hypothetical protein